MIYNAWWFELLMALLALNFAGNIFRYRLYQQKKWAVLLFHIAFIITLLGAFVTRYFGYEGMMLIREGEVSRTVLSENTYVDVLVDNGQEQKDLLSKKVLFGSLSDNYFEINDDFRGKKFSLKYVDVVPHAKLVFREDKTQPETLHIVVSTGNGKEDLYLAHRESKYFENYLFSYNKPVPGGFNFYQEHDTLALQPAVDGDFMEMRSRKTTAVSKDSLSPVYYKKLYHFKNLSFVIPEKPRKGRLQYIAAPANERSKYPYDALFLDLTSGNASEQILLLGAKNTLTAPRKIKLNGLNFTIKYGSKEIKLPFAVKLRDFQLERYPGSNSPSSFASEITLIDTDSIFDYRIFMNHVLDYKGFRFFQSSYDPDEKGTHLSVNHDFWGTWITYLGYILMGIGMFFSLFVRGSRFTKLSEKLRKLVKHKTLLYLLFLSLPGQIFAQNVLPEQHSVAKEHARKFGRLLIQDHQGRIKPVNTYALEALRKIYKKDTYKGLTAEQVLLSAQLFPKEWSEKPIVKIVYPAALGKEIASKLQAKNHLVSMMHFFVDGKYYLEDKVARSFQNR